jgi:hypothetical protein
MIPSKWSCEMDQEWATYREYEYHENEGWANMVNLKTYIYKNGKWEGQ